MINQIVTYFKTDRSWDGGVKLFKTHGRNLMLLRKFNLQGETPKNLEILHYQLWKLTGKPEKEFLSIMRDEILVKEQPKQDPVLESEDTDNKPLSVVEATKIRLRDEFPFLGEKDCPDAFKILVADMLTAHEKYVQAHEELYNVTDEKEAFEAADRLIANYLDNRAIWEELEHFKTTSNILGEHPYFEDQKRKVELTAMSVPELIKLSKRLEMNIWRNKKKLIDDPKPHLEIDRQKSIANYERDLKVVKGLLNTGE